jgi:predicted small lipoprotein YifL
MRARASLLLPLALLLAACGQKGELYIPSPEREAVATVPADATLPTTAPTEDDEERELVQPPAPGNTPDPGR